MFISDQRFQTLSDYLKAGNGACWHIRGPFESASSWVPNCEVVAFAIFNLALP